MRKSSFCTDLPLVPLNILTTLLLVVGGLTPCVWLDAKAPPPWHHQAGAQQRLLLFELRPYCSEAAYMNSSMPKCETDSVTEREQLDVLSGSYLRYFLQWTRQTTKPT